MLNSSKLNDMICEKFGSVAAFSRVETGIPYTSIKYSISSDERCGKMPVDNFIKIAKRLEITPDELYDKLEITEAE